MCRKLFTATALILILALSAPAATWNVDKVHSSVGFSVRHMVIAKVKGQFGEFEGAVQFDGGNVETGSVEVAVQMASVDTDDEKRDGHLTGPDFFDVEKYPTMSFKSKKVMDKGKGRFQLTGMLNIRDVIKEVTFDCEFNGTLNDPSGNVRAGFSAETEINRQDFNVNWSKTLDGGGLVVGDMVTVMIELELIKSDEQAPSGQ